MAKDFARDNDAEAIANREIRERLAPRRVRLRKVDLFVVAMLGAPGAHPTLEGAQDAVTEALAVTLL